MVGWLGGWVVGFSGSLDIAPTHTAHSPEVLFQSGSGGSHRQSELTRTRTYLGRVETEAEVAGEVAEREASAPSFRPSL